MPVLDHKLEVVWGLVALMVFTAAFAAPEGDYGLIAMLPLSLYGTRACYRWWSGQDQRG